jgi:G3E family GTPase
LFDYEKAEASAGWLKELENEHLPETEEYGIGSFVFRSKKPFHPERFLNYLNQSFPQNIIRSKGLFWLASRANQALVWSSAGGSCKADSAGVWWASMTFSQRTNNASFNENKDQIESDWDALYGDRKIELVFIGQHLDKEGIIDQLNTCLLTEEEVKLWKNKAFTQKDQWPIAV